MTHTTRECNRRYATRLLRIKAKGAQCDVPLEGKLQREGTDPFPSVADKVYSQGLRAAVRGGKETLGVGEGNEQVRLLRRRVTAEKAIHKSLAESTTIQSLAHVNPFDLLPDETQQVETEAAGAQGGEGGEPKEQGGKGAGESAKKRGGGGKGVRFDDQQQKEGGVQHQEKEGGNPDPREEDDQSGGAQQGEGGEAQGEGGQGGQGVRKQVGKKKGETQQGKASQKQKRKAKEGAQMGQGGDITQFLTRAQGAQSEADPATGGSNSRQQQPSKPPSAGDPSIQQSSGARSGGKGVTEEESPTEDAMDGRGTVGAKRKGAVRGGQDSEVEGKDEDFPPLQHAGKGARATPHRQVNIRTPPLLAQLKAISSAGGANVSSRLQRQHDEVAMDVEGIEGDEL